MNNYFTLDAITSSLSTVEGIKHAVLQSLFNHGEATANDRARMGENIRGGCWYETYTALAGSRCWTLEREKNLEQTKRNLKQFSLDSLQWLVEQAVIKSVEVEVMGHSFDAVTRNITITLLDDNKMSIEA